MIIYMTVMLLFFFSFKFLNLKTKVLRIVSIYFLRYEILSFGSREFPVNY